MHMRSTLLLFICCFLFQTVNGSVVEINGTVRDMRSRVHILFKQKILPGSNAKTVDSLLLDTNSFKLSYSNLEPGYYELIYKDSTAKAGALVLIDDGTYKIEVLIDTVSVFSPSGKFQLRKVLVNGSRDNHLIDRYFDLRKHYYIELISPLETSIRALSGTGENTTLDSLNALLITYKKEMNAKLKDMILNSMGTSIGIYQTMPTWDNADLDFMKSVMMKFRKERMGSFILEPMEAKYQQLLQTSLIGKTPPLFALRNEMGELVKIEDLIQENRMVLLDFWASWCGPCLKEMRGYKKVYDQLRKKGLVIISISTDKKINQWKQSIAENEFLWKHLLDEAGEVASKYGVSQVPTTFLIQNGVIVEKNITLVNLLKKQW